MGQKRKHKVMNTVVTLFTYEPYITAKGAVYWKEEHQTSFVIMVMAWRHHIHRDKKILFDQTSTCKLEQYKQVQVLSKKSNYK